MTCSCSCSSPVGSSRLLIFPARVLKQPMRHPPAGAPTLSSPSTALPSILFLLFRLSQGRLSPLPPPTLLLLLLLLLLLPPPPLSRQLSHFTDRCWRFLRPHTICGTALGSFALVARALLENRHLINWWLTFKAFYGLIALLCGNSYIVGINQIYDIGIDKVNKPYLPIAAGDLSVQAAWLLVLFFVVAGLSIVASNFVPFISSLYCLGLFLGTIYSVPPFRLKRYPIAAFLIISTCVAFFSTLVSTMPPELLLVSPFSGVLQ